MPLYDERRGGERRVSDDLRMWLPIVIQIATTLLTIGVLYGKLGGRLDLIEYRLHRIEVATKLEGQ